jgi:hypothetical protein
MSLISENEPLYWQGGEFPAETLAEFKSNADAGKFADLDQPFFLHDLFFLYYCLNPPAALEVLKIYQRNVSPGFSRKEAEIRMMTDFLKQKGL